MHELLIGEVERYIRKLREDYGYRISLHPRGTEYFISSGELMKYNYHDSKFCSYIKANPYIWKKCVACQDKCAEKSKDTPVFYGMCHAGVCEYVFALRLGEEYLGFISVSGYRGAEREAWRRIGAINEDLLFDEATARRLYTESLQKNPPKEEDVTSLVMPLVRMIEYGNYLIRTSEPASKPGALYVRILRYIRSHYTEKFTTEDIAASLNCSVSTVSHVFASNNGRNISDYTNSLRIASAKELLRYSDQSIAIISASLGFTDSNYFCRVFRRFEDISPKRYRQFCRRESAKKEKE